MRKGLSLNARKELLALGYYGRRDIMSVYEWLVCEQCYFVMPVPKPDGHWEVSVVLLGKVNALDGKMNMFEFGGDYDCWRSAFVGGMEEVIGVLYDAKVRAKVLSDADIAKMRSELKEEGLLL